jgi:hypothetical protein
MFPMSIPKPIGMSSIGSNSYLIAKKMKSRPTRIMIRCPGVALATPVKE